MAAHKNLNEYQFRYRPTGAVKDEDEEYFTQSGQEVPTVYDHMVTVVHKPTKAVVGEMTWPNEGPLYGIGVDDDHQRKGIATNMVLHAQRVSRASKGKVGFPERATNETEDGEAWADAMESKRIPGWY
jgi:ribosomal protein S18 acetylase RimI-like enzyme